MGSECIGGATPDAIGILSLRSQAILRPRVRGDIARGFRATWMKISVISFFCCLLEILVDLLQRMFYRHWYGSESGEVREIAAERSTPHKLILDS